MHERYAVTAGAPAIVLVHGIGVSSRYFLPTAGRLAVDYGVYAPDLLGFGRSDRLAARPTVSRLADVLDAWLDAADLDQVAAFVANSFGCQVVVDLAARRPERVPRLVLVGPTTDPCARTFAAQAGRLAVDVTREPLGLWAIQALDYALHVSKSGFAAFAEMLRDPVVAKLRLVRAPTLVVRGARDPIVPRRWAEEVTAAVRDARLAEVAGAAHAVNYSAPDALARLTLDFLSEHP